MDGCGYFYMSYFDRSLKTEESYNFDVTGATANSTIINQYNFMPCEAAYGIEQSAPVSEANVFVANQDQYLNELGIITNTENESVTLKVYKLVNKEQRIDEGQLLCTINETFAYKGFHRIKLNQTYFIANGEVFAVSMTQQSRGKYIMGVSRDANRLGFDNGKAGDHYYCVSVVNPGESFLYTSKDDKWTDFTIIKQQLESGEGDAKYFTFDNFPIKAYSIPVVSPTPPSPDIPDPSISGTPDTGDDG